MLARAHSDENSTSNPPTWKNGRGVQNRSSAVGRSRDASAAASCSRVAWLCTQPRGRDVVPEVYIMPFSTT